MRQLTWSISSSSTRNTIQEIQFEDGNKTLAGLDLYKTEQELAIAHPGREQHFGGFHDVKAHCIAYPLKILLSFQNKTRTADSSDNEFIVKVCV